MILRGSFRRYVSQHPESIWAWTLFPISGESSKGFGCSHFARHYFGNAYRFTAAHCSMFHWLLRCFNSPGALLTAYVFSRGFLIFHQEGFPIRTSPDQRLVTTSPRLIAGSYVLLRCAMSRHPPYALTLFNRNHEMRWEGKP